MLHIPSIHQRLIIQLDIFLTEALPEVFNCCIERFTRHIRRENWCILCPRNAGREGAIRVEARSALDRLLVVTLGDASVASVAEKWR
jgi:hypothetical protein